MSKDALGKRRRAKLIDLAVDARTLEINLFWQRSLFFWGLIAAAFVAYAELRDKSCLLAETMSGLGLAFSWGWTLAARGSKYWQEAWEQKLERVADAEVKDLFSRQEPSMSEKGPLSGKRYSVTRITIFLGYITSLAWLGFLIAETSGRVSIPETQRSPFI